MSYCIMRLMKLKLSTDIYAMQEEYLNRDSKFNKNNTNIDRTRSHLNIPIVGLDGESSLLSKTNKYIKSKFIPSKGCYGIRKDAVKIITFFFGSDNAKMSELNDTGQLNDFFNDCIEWLGNHFGGKENVMLFVPHYDETTIHAHACICPMTVRGTLSARSFIGSKFILQNLQTSFYKEVGEKYGMQRGERTDLSNTKPRMHIPPAVMRANAHVDKIIECRKKFKECEKKFKESEKNFEESERKFEECKKKLEEQAKESLECEKVFIEHKKEFVEYEKEFEEYKKEFTEYKTISAF